MAELPGLDVGEGAIRECKNFSAYRSWGYKHRYAGTEALVEGRLLAL